MTLNLLPTAMAATAILGCNKQFQLYKYLGTVIDDMGRDAPQFALPIPQTGSIQPVSNKMYEQMGLNLDNNYKIVYSPALIQSIAQEVQPDRIVYENRTFEVVENKDWYETNGYTKALMVELKELRQNENGTDTVQNQKPNF